MDLLGLFLSFTYTYINIQLRLFPPKRIGSGDVFGASERKGQGNLQSVPFRISLAFVYPFCRLYRFDHHTTIYRFAADSHLPYTRSLDQPDGALHVCYVGVWPQIVDVQTMWYIINQFSHVGRPWIYPP